MKLVIDASIAVKWIVDEPDRDLALNLLRNNPALYAPDFIAIEIGNVLWKKARSSLISSDQAKAGLNSLSLFFEELAPSARFITRAMELALRLDHPVYDCLYLACAESLDKALVTADERFIRKAREPDLDVQILPLTAFAAP